ncbi:cytochrome P450 [Streptomyces litchfieldiae]|uniref:Cytochrome P450 n=1 Tax=Streptomyces litchfieldiae TaxID=3075543 RepID=A0ABU2MY16_9ACTN|nr:cytochrome P450 [Streptomyces sp. DSM 44938]MDT0345444.1 cytochrome P450 [Streptomyces sp. DSM 44938]
MTGPPVPLPVKRENPFDPPRLLDAYRETEPVRRLVYPDGHVGWLVTGYELAKSVLADRRFSARSELKRVPVSRPGADPFIGQPALPGWIVDMDAPEHTRVRRLVAARFGAARTAALRPKIEAIAERCLDALADAGPPADLVTHFALPVPSLVICELLGVPYGDRDAFQHNSTVLFSLEASAADGERAMTALTDYLLELIEHKRRHPAGDLLGSLVAGGELAPVELAGLCVLLLTAGHETVASMLGLGVFALLSHPEQWAALVADPGLVEGAVEELLRYLTIFQFGVPRTPLTDVELGGHLLRAGESVTVSLPAANRAPERFPCPHALDVRREPRSHLAFGHGIHKCVGQHLAREELAIGYRALLRRFPGLRLAVPPERVRMHDDMGFYGVHGLPVTWSPGHEAGAPAPTTGGKAA